MSASRKDVTLPSEPTRRAKMVALVVVALVLGLLIGLRVVDRVEDAQPLEAGVLVDPEAAAGPDPFEVYQDARAAGMPMYVLFHSGACEPCVEAREVASRVLPEYEDTVVYVSAHTVDPRSRDLFDEFSFRSVPTSYFLASDGSVVDRYVGPMSDEDLREALDGIAAGR
jgi:thiol-disulfide isomerase/thioredoxin